MEHGGDGMVPQQAKRTKLKQKANRKNKEAGGVEAEENGSAEK